MKKTMAISILTFLCLVGQPIIAASAPGTENNNEMMKQCLDVWGFNREEPDIKKRFAEVNMMQIAGCIQGFRREEWRARIEEDREFVKKHPWFRGSNYRWQLRAEYKCKIVSTSNLGPVEVCSKPYYVN